MPQLLRVRTAARLLDMPRSTVYALIKRGIIRALRIPTGHEPDAFIVRIPAAEVARIVEGVPRESGTREAP